MRTNKLFLFLILGFLVGCARLDSVLKEANCYRGLERVDDSFDCARPIEIGSVVSDVLVFRDYGAGDWVDYYAIAVDAPLVLTIEVDSLKSGGYIALELFDHLGNRVERYCYVENNAGSSGLPIFAKCFLGAQGVYYIKLYLSSVLSVKGVYPYKLRIEKDLSDVYEVNNQIDLAYPVSLDSLIILNGALQTGVDVDVFKIDVSNADSVYFEVWNEDCYKIGWRAQVVDKYGNNLSYLYGLNDSEMLEINGQSYIFLNIYNLNTLDSYYQDCSYVVKIINPTKKNAHER